MPLYPTQGTKTSKPRLDSPALRAMTRQPVGPPRMLGGGAPPVPPALPTVPQPYSNPDGTGAATMPPGPGQAARMQALDDVGARYAAKPGGGLPGAGDGPSLPGGASPTPAAQPPPTAPGTQGGPPAPSAIPQEPPGKYYAYSQAMGPGTGDGATAPAWNTDLGDVAVAYYGAGSEKGRAAPSSWVPPPAGTTPGYVDEEGIWHPYQEDLKGYDDAYAGQTHGAETAWTDPETGEWIVPSGYDEHGWPLDENGNPMDASRVPKDMVQRALEGFFGGMAADYAGAAPAGGVHPGLTAFDTVEQGLEQRTKDWLGDEPGIDESALTEEELAILRKADQAKAQLADQMAAAGIGGTGAHGLNIGNIDAAALNEIANMRLQAQLAEDETITQRLGMLLSAGFQQKSLDQQAEQFAKTFGLDEKKLQAMLEDQDEADAWAAFGNWIAATGADKADPALVAKLVEGLKSGKTLTQLLEEYHLYASGGTLVGKESAESAEQAYLGGDVEEFWKQHQDPPPNWTMDDAAWYGMSPEDQVYYWYEYLKTQGWTA